nr:hypothetical protein [Tanacetum cinerariifolium]GEY56692.1 hypothetical protein [Tanacetum cinerariifolium]
MVDLMGFEGDRENENAKEITSWISTGGRRERKRGGCCERDDIVYKSSAERPKKVLAFLSGETTEALKQLSALFLRKRLLDGNQGEVFHLRVLLTKNTCCFKHQTL